jgi:hypothetical protein
VFFPVLSKLGKKKYTKDIFGATQLLKANIYILFKQFKIIFNAHIFIFNLKFE